jgi:hypothetical protein
VQCAAVQGVGGQRHENPPDKPLWTKTGNLRKLPVSGIGRDKAGYMPA